MKYFDYESTIEIESVSLNVFDIEKQTEFYKNVIGLDVINHDLNYADLGVDGKILLNLNKVNSSNRNKETGLYHMAFLLPSRKDLGNAFKHLINVNQRLQGASDHNYSEAIYLEDNEGNGIEIYADKPREKWERDDNGLPVGKTVAMDVSGVLALGEEIQYYTIPKGTRIGHVHLKVLDELKTTKLYQNIFPMSDKLTLPTASFIAGGDYHHHLAMNTWEQGLKVKTQDSIGLNFINMNISDKEKFNEIKTSKNDSLGIYEENDKIVIKDLLNGINFKLKLID